MEINYYWLLLLPFLYLSYILLRAYRLYKRSFTLILHSDCFNHRDVFINHSGVRMKIFWKYWKKKQEPYYKYRVITLNDLKRW